MESSEDALGDDVCQSEVMGTGVSYPNTFTEISVDPVQQDLRCLGAAGAVRGSSNIAYANQWLANARAPI